MNRTIVLVVTISFGIVLAGGCSPHDIASSFQGDGPPQIETLAAIQSLRGNSISGNGQLMDATESREAFEAPFPNRENPFYRADLGKAGASTAQKSTSSSDNFIQLRGFVNVGEPRAILSIGGNVTSLTVGEQDLGVRVVAIKPPSVTLEARKRVWSQTLLAEGVQSSSARTTAAISDRTLKQTDTPN